MVDKIKELVDKLNKASEVYYNTSDTLMTDKEWDSLYDELLNLEKETGIILTNSPTQKVGYKVISEFEEVKHKYPLLSLDKTQNIDELHGFARDKDCILMLKYDGLTIDIEYNDGKLIKAATRGNGEIGEDITHNIVAFTNVPLTIPIKENINVFGEAIITYDKFNEINSKIKKEEDKYKNPRNLVSGSVRQLDSKVCKQRGVKFIAYGLNGLDIRYKDQQFKTIEECGFEVAKEWWGYAPKVDRKDLEVLIENLKERATKRGIPIDGLVMTFRDMEYGKSLGRTSKFPRHSMAFKFYDEAEETILREIEWQVGRTGTITPVAIFDTVELDGTDVSKASLHNISIIEALELGIGDTITIFKANQIIPQVRENLTKSNVGTLNIPEFCPECGCVTRVKQSEKTKILVCTNDNCKAKLVQRIKHYCSKNAINVEGLSEKTIEKFIEKGFLNSISDIYTLKDRKEIKRMEGFGAKSFNKLVESIERSKKCKLENFIYALGIPNVGKTTAKTLVEFVKEMPYLTDNSSSENLVKMNFLTVEKLLKMKDCGEIVANSIVDWFSNQSNIDLVNSFVEELEFIEENKEVIIVEDNPLKNKHVYPTGKFSLKKNDLKKELEKLGAIVENGYKKSLDYLIVAGDTSKSSKKDRAIKDNVKLFTEEELMKLIK
ncbi:NAD-dependent DNA ligase LigA [Clostridium perfringens]|uniref:NAD-dependent DNA ligase LigA n=1 Tax=Clostridium perfringens TaxID=1502 RepID=UPI00096AAF9D|nr:NAD-dependent DNA ligase LigA [Clostridium perfringens]